MKNRIRWWQWISLGAATAGAAGLSGCKSISTVADTIVIASGSCAIDFQPGVKDWQWKVVSTVSESNATLSGGFGPTVGQGSAPAVVQQYNFGFSSSWLSVRCANPGQDGHNLNEIWSTYNGASVDPDGSIVTTAFGLCVVEYNWSKINSVPFGGPTDKHLHKFRIIARSKPGKTPSDSVLLTVYANADFPSGNDPEQLNITMMDTEATQVVEIVREIQ